MASLRPRDSRGDGFGRCGRPSCWRIAVALLSGATTATDPAEGSRSSRREIAIAWSAAILRAARDFHALSPLGSPGCFLFFRVEGSCMSVCFPAISVTGALLLAVAFAPRAQAARPAGAAYLPVADLIVPVTDFLPPTSSPCRWWSSQSSGPRPPLAQRPWKLG